MRASHIKQQIVESERSATVYLVTTGKGWCSHLFCCVCEAHLTIRTFASTLFGVLKGGSQMTGTFKAVQTIPISDLSLVRWTLASFTSGWCIEFLEAVSFSHQINGASTGVELTQLLRLARQALSR